MFHPRIVPIPNVTITELGITELFYYGLLLPNVTHSVGTDKSLSLIATPSLFGLKFLAQRSKIF